MKSDKEPKPQDDQNRCQDKEHLVAYFLDSRFPRHRRKSIQV
jgi:hypothetical protein